MHGLEGGDAVVWRALNDFGRPAHSKELEQATRLSSREIQHAINRLVVQGYPIGSSSSKGYFICLNEYVWRDALDDLDGRIRELRQRRDGLAEFGRKRDWKERTEPELFGRVA